MPFSAKSVRWMFISHLARDSDSASSRLNSSIVSRWIEWWSVSGKRAKLPEAQRFGTRDIVPAFQPAALLWLGDRLACLLSAVELLRMREGRSAYAPAIARIVQTPDAERLNAPKFRRRLSNGEIFPLASH
jgi:hypothetical protein